MRPLEDPGLSFDTEVRRYNGRVPRATRSTTFRVSWLPAVDGAQPMEFGTVVERSEGLLLC